MSKERSLLSGDECDHFPGCFSPTEIDFSGRKVNLYLKKKANVIKYPYFK
jgi:hypothetical protein